MDQINANSLIRSDQMGSGVMAGIIILQSGLSGPGWVNGLDEAQSIVLSFRTPHRIGRVGGGSEPLGGVFGNTNHFSFGGSGLCYLQATTGFISTS